jgi:peptide/nickel transport system ATP-binding protein
MLDLPSDVVLRVDDLKVHFLFRRRVAKAVDGVTFTLRQGQTVAVVGESGSGKSVTGLAILRLLTAPGQIVGGSIAYRDSGGAVLDLARRPEHDMRRFRGSQIAMIFQEPMTSLNPLFTIGDQIAEMVRLHAAVSRQQAMARAREMLDLVEIPAAASRLDDYPHQMSGGMRQRVMIALALACNPRLLIADEPTTALDVTTQSQILQLLRRLQKELGSSILFITHNLGVVAEIAQEVVVMYAGRVVEQAPVHKLFAEPRHPYTRALLNATPNPARDVPEDGPRRRLAAIPGTVPPVTALPAGCAFRPRCDLAIPACEAPVSLLAVGADHVSRCIRHESLV